jgi:cell division protein FtsN
MEPQSADAGTELVLDNGKLILGFVLLVALCGACFVIGFMEGKRQAIQAKVDSMAPLTPASTPPGEPPAAAGIKITESPATAPPAKDRSVREPLDWYKNVQRNEPGTGKVLPAAEPASQGISPPASAASGKATYTVQVGAFRNMREAEAKGGTVQSKGFLCTIDPPKAPEQLYLVKVGKFASRAEAVAMQRKLTKAGFSCFIKTN